LYIWNFLFDSIDKLSHPERVCPRCGHALPAIDCFCPVCAGKSEEQIKCIREKLQKDGEAQDRAMDHIRKYGLYELLCLCVFTFLVTKLI